MDIPYLPTMPANVSCGKKYEWSFKDLQHRLCPACDGDQPRIICIRPDKLRVHMPNDLSI